MRVVAYILIFLGVIFIADAVRDDFRGIASARSPSRGGTRHVISRAEDPERFRSLMAYQWLRAPVVLVAGLVILGIARRADRLDPFSPDFGGAKALDELDRTLAGDERKQRESK